MLLSTSICAVSSEELILKSELAKVIRDTGISTAPKTSPAPTSPNVVMIAELFRHGARWTLYNIFKEEDIDKNNGMLSPTGMRQHYNLGKAVRKTYPQLFDQEYNHNKMTMTSTHVPRTVESAQSHLMGMYDLGTGFDLTTTAADFLTPPYAKNQSNVKSAEDHFALPFGYRPIPIFARDIEEDRMFMDNLKTVCPNAYSVVDKFKKEHNDWLDKSCLPTSDALKKAGYNPMEMFGKPDFGLRQTEEVFDYMKAYYFKHGEHHPKMTEELYSKIEIAYSVSFFSNWALPDIQKLWAHNITKDIIKKFKARIQDPTKNQVTYVGMSGHDSNIASFWNIVGLNSFKCLTAELVDGKKDPNCHTSIEYAANIIWELSTARRSADDLREVFLVRMVRDGKHMFGCEQEFTGLVPEFDGYCTFEEFETAAEKMFMLPDQKTYDELCGAKSG